MVCPPLEVTLLLILPVTLPKTRRSRRSRHIARWCTGPEIRSILPRGAGRVRLPFIPFIPFLHGEVPLVLVELQHPLPAADRAREGLFVGAAQAHPLLCIVAVVRTRDAEMLPADGDVIFWQISYWRLGISPLPLHRRQVRTIIRVPLLGIDQREW